jgi:hypothetical protein
MVHKLMMAPAVGLTLAQVLQAELVEGFMKMVCEFFTLTEGRLLR